jgi:hypothetical protein
MVTARELVGLSPTADEITWAREQTRSESHLLALVLSLKCFQRLGYFPTLEEIPEVVLLHVRRCLGLKEDVGPTRGERTATTQRVLVRRRVGVTYDPERALAVAADAIRTAAAVKNNPPDLINVALEMLVRASLELPGFRHAQPDDLSHPIRGQHRDVRADRCPDLPAGPPPPGGPAGGHRPERQERIQPPEAGGGPSVVGRLSGNRSSTWHG